MANKIIFNFILINLIHFSITQNDYDYCSTFNKEVDCVNANPSQSSLLPLYQGRCCWKEDICLYIEKPFLSYIEYNDFNCGTQIEKCYKTKLNNDIFNKNTCHSLNVEKPYKCCYIKYQYHASCFPVDISNKKVFKLLENHLKPYFGFFEPGKIEIDCKSNYQKFSYSLFFSLLILI